MSVAPSNLLPVTFSQANIACQPRACVKLNHLLYPLKSFKINKSAYGATNTASFVVPYSGNPDWTKALFRDTATTYDPIPVEIWAGFPSSPSSTPTVAGLSKRFAGVLDIYDPEDMDTTEFHCRSVAAPLTTDRITTAVQNLTTVAFIKQVCAPYNIPVVVDPTLQPTTLVKIYSQDYVVGLHNLIKWDVLLRASVFDDVDVWEDDGTLYYVHPWNVASVVPTLSKMMDLKYGTDILSFKPSHSPQFNRNIRITVSSYLDRTRVSSATRVQTVTDGVQVRQVIKTSTATPNFGVNGGTSVTYGNDGSVTYGSWTSSGGPSQGSNAPIADSGLEKYTFTYANLTPTECQQRAELIWRQISQHEYQGEFELAVTPDLLPLLNIESRISLTGYGMSRFNTEYWPRTLEESFEMADENSDEAKGWTATIKGVNHTLPLGGV